MATENPLPPSLPCAHPGTVSCLALRALWMPSPIPLKTFTPSDGLFWHLGIYSVGTWCKAFGGKSVPSITSFPYKPLNPRYPTFFQWDLELATGLVVYSALYRKRKGKWSQPAFTWQTNSKFRSPRSGNLFLNPTKPFSLQYWRETGWTLWLDNRII